MAWNGADIHRSMWLRAVADALLDTATGSKLALRERDNAGCITHVSEFDQSSTTGQFNIIGVGAKGQNIEFVVLYRQIISLQSGGQSPICQSLHRDDR